MKDKILLGAIGLLSISLGISIGFGVYKYKNPEIREVEPLTNLVEIPVASTNIGEEEKISEEDISYVSIPDDEIPDGVLKNVDEIIDKYVNKDNYIATNSLFYEYQVSAEVSEKVEHLSSGMYLYPIRVSDTSFYNSGDYINLELVGELNGTFMEGIKVIEVGDNYLYIEVLSDTIRYLSIIARTDGLTLVPKLAENVSDAGPMYANEYFNTYLDSKGLNL